MVSTDFSRGLVLVAATSLLAFSGCSDGRLPTFPVDGKIQFDDGFSVKYGTIELRSREHQVQARGTIDDGKFTLKTYEEGDGAVAGTHDCVVVQMVMQEDVLTHAGTLGIVPPKYSSYKTSDLTCTIQESESNLVILKIEPLPSASKEAKSHKPLEQPKIEDADAN